MSDFRLNVIAETQAAERKLQQVDKAADSATKARKLEISLASPEKISKQFKNIKSNVKEATNDIKQFYGIAKKLPVLGEPLRNVEDLAKGTANLAKSAPAVAAGLAKSAKASNILATSTRAASSATRSLAEDLVRAGLAFFAVKQSVGLLQSAYSGFFNQTIGREIKLQETILKTQTALASTGRVFSNGLEITDPLQKIEALTGQIEKRIESIRERSLELAGVTSNDVIEVFGIVAQQVQAIGGGLKDAEDLAIQFSAALGTFGIPLYQARQEIGSILRGDITMDSYLAKALGITNEDVAKAKTSTEGVIGFLESRLKASVAGQAIAAKSFAGVTSNIAEIFEEVNRAFGKGMLDPLLDGLTVIYENLFGIYTQLKDIAGVAGTAVGKLLRIGAVGILGGTASQLSASLSGIAQTVKTELESAFSTLQADLVSTLTPLRTIFEQFTSQIALLAAGLKELAIGFADISIETFKTLVQVISNLASILTPLVAGFSQILKVYGEILKLPGVQYFAQLAATFKTLEVLGVSSLLKLAVGVTAFAGSWSQLVAAVQRVRVAVSTALAFILRTVQQVAINISGIIAGLVISLSTLGKSTTKLRAELEIVSATFNKVAASANAAGAATARFGGAAALAGNKIKGAIVGLIAVAAKLFAIQLVITVVIDLFGRFQKHMDNLAQDRRAEQALKRIEAGAYDAADGLTAAQRAMKELDEAEVQIKFDRLKADLKDAVNDLEKFKEDSKGILDPIYADTKSGKIAQGELNRLQKRIDFVTRALNALDERAGKKNTEDKIEYESDKRVNLEKEIGQLQRQQADTLFRKRQQLAQKEIELFRAAGELRIRQMERANAKLIEGEEGASAAALEALNNYLSVRERGELDIEAKKKELAVTVANLDKEVADYRFETEKKITELKKRIGEYETKVADYRVQKAKEEAEARSRSAGGRAGNFNDDLAGRLTGAIVAKESGGDYTAVNPDSGAIGIGQVMPANIGPWTQKYYSKRLTPEQYRYNREAQDAVVSGRIKDMLFEQINAGYSDEMAARRVAAQWYSGNPNLESSTRPQYSNGNEYPSISAYATDIVTRMGSIPNTMPGGGTAPPQTPQAPVPPSLDTGSLANISAGADTLAGLQERLKSLFAEVDKVSAALTEEERVAAFERIAKAAFPQAQLEQYENRLTELGYNYDAIANSSAEAFNPERSAVEVTRLTQMAVASRELQQIQQGIAERTNLSDAERAKLLDDIQAKYQVYLNNVDREAQLKRNILTTEQATAQLAQMRSQARDIYREIEALKLRNSLEAEGVAPEFIAAEVAKLDIQREVKRITTELNAQLNTQIELRDRLQKQIAGAADADKADLQKQLDDARAQIESLRKQLQGVPEAGAGLAAAEDARARAATEPGTRIASFIGNAKRELEDLEGTAIRVSQSIGDAVGNALSSGITGLIEGTTTAEQVFADFLKNIGQILIQEATKMIATYVAIGIARQFAGLLGGGAKLNTSAGVSMSAGTATQSGFDMGSALAGMFRASGGPVNANQPYIVGERGPELFMPFSSGMVMSNEKLQAQNRAFLDSIYTENGEPASDDAETERQATAATQAAVRGSELEATAATRDAVRENERIQENRMQILSQQKESDRLYENERIQENRMQIMSQQKEFDRRYERERIEQMASTPGKLNIKYESQVINSVEYVTREQAERMAAQSALRGRELAIGSLQNSVKTRKLVGMS